MHEFENLTPKLQSAFIEWLVAQEIWRRSVLKGDANPEAIGFWASKEHEIDFVTPDLRFIEVKKGKANPFEFSWFPNVFPKEGVVENCAFPLSFPLKRESSAFSGSPLSWG